MAGNELAHPLVSAPRGPDLPVLHQSAGVVLPRWNLLRCAYLDFHQRYAVEFLRGLVDGFSNSVEIHSFMIIDDTLLLSSH